MRVGQNASPSPLSNEPESEIEGLAPGAPGVAADAGQAASCAAQAGAAVERGGAMTPAGPAITGLMGDLLRATLDAAAAPGALAGGLASPLGAPALAELLRAALALFKATQRDPGAADAALQDALFDHPDLCGRLQGFASQLASDPQSAILGGLATLSEAVPPGSDGRARLDALCPRVSGQRSGSASVQGRRDGRAQIGDVRLRGHVEGRAGAQGQSSGQTALGLDGLTARGAAEGSLGAYGAARGRIAAGSTSLDAGVHGGAGLRGDAQGQMQIGRDGAQASGSANARLGLEAGADAALRSRLLDANGRIAADVGLYGNATGTARADASGVSARGRAEVGARAQVEVEGDFRTAGTSIGGQRLDLNGHVRATAEVSARASVEADVAATLRPPRVLCELGGEAFAGAKAGVRGSVGLGDFVTLSGHAEAWAGAGASAGLIVGYDDGKLRFGFHAGAALEVGAGAGVGIEIDVKAIASALGGLVAEGLGIDLSPEELEVLGLMLLPELDLSEASPDPATRQDQVCRELRDLERAVLEAARCASRAA